tara:strand:+ start:3309 stop:3818 length:510 start_codon:yes stop_codon:yes gene_type:complete
MQEDDDEGISWEDALESVENAQKAIESLGFPVIKELEAPEDLDWSDVHNASDKELAKYLVLYNGEAAYMETVVSEVEAFIVALEAAYDEEYSKAVYRVVTEYEEAGKKKPTNDQTHSEVVSRSRELRKQKRKIVAHKVDLKRKASLLKVYSSLGATISRIVTLRKESNQ